jgi:hypothetical protein
MAETVKPNRRIIQHELQSAEYKRRDLIAQPEAGTTLAEMLDPNYWTHVAKQLQPGDRIDVRPADGSWFAELLVRAVAPFAAKVHVLQHVEFDAQAATERAPDPEGYELKHRGKNGWCVVRSVDKVVLTQEHPSAEAARLWLTQHLAKVA